MALNSAEWTDLNRLLAGGDPLDQLRPALQERFPQLRVKVMDALDLRDETPLLQQAGYTVYLMESDGHCWQVTTDPGRAAGVILAR